MDEIIIEGRPDMESRCRGQKEFGVTKAKRFPSHVFSNDANGCLVHQVRHIKFRWYELHTSNSLRWLNAPSVFVTTRCGQVFFPRARAKRRADDGFTMCELPSSDAVICGRCQGGKASFQKGVQSYPERRAARQRLGCVARVEALNE